MLKLNYLMNVFNKKVSNFDRQNMDLINCNKIHLVHTAINLDLTSPHVVRYNLVYFVNPHPHTEIE